MKRAKKAVKPKTKPMSIYPDETEKEEIERLAKAHGFPSASSFVVAAATGKVVVERSRLEGDQ